MMGVEHYTDHLDATTIVEALLGEFSTVTDYRTLRDNLPRRLAVLLKCRCVLLYQLMGETLQFASGSFADQPGWSSTLLAVAHINPIELHSGTPESRAWLTRRPVCAPLTRNSGALVSAPLIYRQRAIGALTAIRGLTAATFSENAGQAEPFLIQDWLPEEVPMVAMAANVVAMLLENTRLLERDRERIHELSLLNGITSQINCSLHERDRVYRIVIQRTKEISPIDLCDVLTPDLTVDEIDWLPPELCTLLLQRWQANKHYEPLIIERNGDFQEGEYMSLSPLIKTFFALPLLGTRKGNRANESTSPFASYLARESDSQGTVLLGVVAGAYYTPWKLRREELVLFQILANQASTVLENILLMEDVVDARHEARRLLRQVLDDQRLKELILEGIPSGLITVDTRGHITTFNRAAETVLGYHPREVMDQPIHKILALRNLEEVQRTGKSQHETLLTTGRQGQDIALDVTLMPLHDDRSHQIGALATFVDMTSMRHLEEEKRRLDRLASLGEMSASVAHEVRNPLASIKTSMQMLLADLESDTPSQADQGTQEAISVVLKEVERLNNIVHDLLLFARSRQIHPVACNFAELSERLLHLLKPQCSENGVTVSRFFQEPPSVNVDVVQMEQVLLNLFLNALQAMPDGGILSISCHVVESPRATSGTNSQICFSPPLASTHFNSPEEGAAERYELTEREQAKQEQVIDIQMEKQKWLEFAVSDTGSGIAQKDLDRIFQPFYTTKAHGIGLGLPITRRLVEDHHGYILVESRLGYGTTVSVRLPLNTS